MEIPTTLNAAQIVSSLLQHQPANQIISRIAQFCIYRPANKN